MNIAIFKSPGFWTAVGAVVTQVGLVVQGQATWAGSVTTILAAVAGIFLSHQNTQQAAQLKSLQQKP